MPIDGAGDHRRLGGRKGARRLPEQGYRPAGGDSRLAAEAERENRGWRQSDSPLVVDGLGRFRL
jgi:hypothetical protein